MILVFGGAYQGKKEFAVKGLGTLEENLWDLNDEAVVDFLLDTDQSPEDWVDSNWGELDGKTVILRDISQGLVPMDPGERAYREANGRLLIALANRADQVYRVFCGIGTKIK